MTVLGLRLAGAKRVPVQLAAKEAAIAKHYQDELRARFPHDIDLGGDVPKLPWLRQVLLRRTHRRYSDRPVPDALVRLLLAAAFSASSKSDFQQASVVWLNDC